MKNRPALIFWLVLSWSLIVAARYPGFNQLVLNAVIPGIFICLFIAEGKLILNNRSLNHYIIFFIWCCFSIIYTVNTPMTLGYLYTMLGNIILWYSAYRLTFYLRGYRYPLLILGGALLFHAIQGIIIPVEIIEGMDYGRVMGIYKNPNGLGFSMWYGVVIATFFILDTDRKSYKFFFIISILLFLWVLFSSGSRKNAIACIVFLGVLIYYFSKGRYRWSLLIILVIGIIAYHLVLDSILSETAVGARMQGDTLERGATNRGRLIEEGFSFFFKYPLLGVGLGSFTSFSSSGLMSHNDYIEILSSTGIIGFFLYMPIFWHFLKDTKILLDHPHTYKLGVVARGFLIGYIFLGMGRPAFLDPVAILVFGFFQTLVLKTSVQIALSKNNQKEKTKQNAHLPDHQHA